jgi:DNA-binding CsgD family transcriptional regulator
MQQAELATAAAGWHARPDDDERHHSHGGAAIACPDIRYFDDPNQPASAHRVGADGLFEGEPDGRLQIASDLASARTAVERTRLVKGLLSLIGFADVAYLSVRLDAHEQVERVYLSRGFGSEYWTSHYFASGRHRRDPRLQAVLGARAPHVWDLQTLADAYRRAGSPASLRALIDESSERGAGSGLMFCIPVAQTRLRSIVSFTSPTQHAGWIGDAVIAQALAFGLSLHQHCSPAVRALERGALEAGLSDVQVRVLRFVAAGLSDKEIALRMQTTPHNIDYHLRRLRQKCSVNSRTQLAFLAGRLLSA